MPKYYNNIKGYFRATDGVIIPERYYILSFSNFRKPVLLRLACSTQFMAKRYIIMKTNPIIHEIISGEDAIEMNMRFVSKKFMDNTKRPEKYDYPKGSDWRKKKQHRTKFREIMRKYYSSPLALKQFTIRYRGKIYTTFDFSTLKAFNLLAKHTGMKWKHFVKRVDNGAQAVTKNMIFIKPRSVNIIIINQFNLQNHVQRLKYPPSIGEISKFQRGSLSVQRKKPKRLLF